jgi:hypothetical protein
LSHSAHGAELSRLTIDGAVNRLGEMIAEDMITVRLTPPFPAILVASPA